VHSTNARVVTDLQPRHIDQTHGALAFGQADPRNGPVSREIRPIRRGVPNTDRSAPDPFKAAAGQARVMDGMSGIAMAEVILDQPEIVAQFARAKTQECRSLWG
jgi:hypothetical protein